MLSNSQFLASLGVNIVWGGAQAGYPAANINNVVADLNQLGIRGMRGRAPPALTADNYEWSLARLRVLLDGAIDDYCMLVNTDNVNGVMTPLPVDEQLASCKALMALYPKALYPNKRFYMEMLNEPNYWPLSYDGLLDIKNTGPYPATMRYCEDMVAAMALDPAFKDVLLIGPSAWPLGPTPFPCDVANLHIYPYEGPPLPGEPLPFLTPILAALHALYPGRPWVATEGGYSTDTIEGTMAVDLATAAPLLLQLICQMSRQGCQLFDIYDLYDDAPGSSTDDWGVGCGLFTYGRVLKPAGAALGRLIKYLSGSTTAPIKPAPTIPQIPGVFLLPLQRAAGVIDWLVWNEPHLWNWQTRTPITPAPVVVSLPIGGSKIEIYGPNDNFTQEYVPSADVHLTLHGQPLVVRVTKQINTA